MNTYFLFSLLSSIFIITSSLNGGPISLKMERKKVIVKINRTEASDCCDATSKQCCVMGSTCCAAAVIAAGIGTPAVIPTSLAGGTVIIISAITAKVTALWLRSS